MKMKEVCVATNLTRRTVLFYEEQGFIAPRKTLMNGREYRDYSETDIVKLLEVASLRKFYFTIDEIKQMLGADDMVQPIFSAYKERLVLQQEELEILLHTIATVQEEKLHSVHDLLQVIQAPSKDLPVPETDCVPHFLYLDELEEGITPPKEPSKFHQDKQPMEIDSDHIFVDVSMGRKKMLDELKKDMDSRPVYGVPEPKNGPKWLEWLKTPIVILVILLFLTLPSSSKNGVTSAAFLKVAVGIIILIAVYMIIILIQKRSK